MKVAYEVECGHLLEAGQGKQISPLASPKEPQQLSH